MPNQPAARQGPSIGPLTPTGLVAVLADHHRYWGDRDLRHLHLMALVQEFPQTCLAARSPDARPPDAGDIVGYLLGFPTPASIGYVHAVAVREDARGGGLGRRLYQVFAGVVAEQGAVGLKAITSVTNAGSIAFHRALGFDTTTVEDYSGPGEHRVVFRRPLPLTPNG